MKGRAVSTLVPHASVVVGAGVLLLVGGGLTSQDLALVTSALILGIAASGLGLMWGQAGYLSIAHAALVGVGAYVAATLASQHGLSFAATLPVAIIGGAIAGLVVALAAVRTGGHYFVILTFAIGQIGVVLAGRLDSITGGISGLTLVPPRQTFLGIQIADRHSFFTLVVLTTVVVLTLARVVMVSRWGLSLRTIRDNPELSRSLGLDVGLHRTLIFTVAGAFAGLAGQLYAYHLQFIEPGLFGVDLSVVLLAMVLIGGRLFVGGPLLGAAIYTFLPRVLTLTPTQNTIATGIVFMAIILLRPEGLLSLVGGRSELAGWWRRRYSGTAGGPVPEPAPELEAVRPLGTEMREASR